MPRQLVEQFWQTMNTNDWHAVSALLHDDYVLVYPQSGERFRGRERFIALNSRRQALGGSRCSASSPMTPRQSPM
jgi:hypothetical protein